MARRKRGDFLTKQSNAPDTGVAHRLPLIFISIMSVVGLLMIIAYFFFVSWLQGESCRAKLEDLLQQATHAQQVSIPENLEVSGNKITVPQFTALRAGAFKELSIHRLHVSIDRKALLSRILRMNQLSAEELRLVFQAGTSTTDGVKKEREKPVMDRSQGEERTKNSNFGFFRAVQARTLEVHYADSLLLANNREFGLKGYRMTALPSPEEGDSTWTLNLENGHIVSPYAWLAESGVKSATVKITRDDIKLTSCHILLSPGSIRAKATYSPGTGIWKVRADIQRANVARLLKADWRKKLSGSLAGYLDFKGQIGAAWEASGKIRLEDGVLEDLPILSKIRVNDTTPYRSIKFEKAACNISFPYSDEQHNIHNAWLWDRIDARSEDGNFIVRGRVITGTDGSLSGTLKIAVPQQLAVQLGLENIPVANQLFQKAGELPGYIWVHVNLSGTLDDPHEDFSVRFATILPQLMSSLSDTAVQSLNNVFGDWLPVNATSSLPHHEDDDKTKSSAPPSPAPVQPPVQKVKDIIGSGLDILL